MRVMYTKKAKGASKGFGRVAAGFCCFSNLPSHPPPLSFHFKKKRLRLIPFMYFSLLALLHFYNTP